MPSAMAIRINCVNLLDIATPRVSGCGECGRFCTARNKLCWHPSVPPHTLPVILRSRALARRLEGWPPSPALVAHPSRLAAKRRRAPQDDGEGVGGNDGGGVPVIARSACDEAIQCLLCGPWIASLA